MATPIDDPARGTSNRAAAARDPGPIDDGGDGADTGDDADVSLLGLLNVLLRYRVLIVAMALALGVATAAVTLASVRSYEATATFVPQGKSGSGGVSGLAAQLGINVPGGDPAQSPEFYVDLAESRDILSGVADTRFSFPTDSGAVTATAVHLWGDAQERTPALRRESAIERLGDQITARVAGTTGVVSLTVSAPNPVLAQRVAQRVLELINRFNLESRQSQAAAERRFTEGRLAEVRADLRTAENRLEAFLVANRGFASPTLQFEQDRLRREVDLQQQLFVAMASAYEQAKVEEVRDTPVITVIESPEVPVRAEARGTVRKTLLALLGGALLGVALAFLLDFTGQVRSDVSPEAREFRALRRDALGDLTHPWRPLGRLFRRRGVGG